MESTQFQGRVLSPRPSVTGGSRWRAGFPWPRVAWSLTAHGTPAPALVPLLKILSLAPLGSPLALGKGLPQLLSLSGSWGTPWDRH